MWPLVAQYPGTHTKIPGSGFFGAPFPEIQVIAFLDDVQNREGEEGCKGSLVS